MPVPLPQTAEPLAPCPAVAGVGLGPEQPGQILLQRVPGEPPVTAAQHPVVGRVGADEVGAVGHLQARIQRLPRLPQLLVVQRKDHRCGEALPLRRPVVEHPQHQLGKILHAEGEHRGQRLFIEVQLTVPHPGQQPGDARRGPGAVAAI